MIIPFAIRHPYSLLFHSLCTEPYVWVIARPADGTAEPVIELQARYNTGLRISENLQADVRLAYIGSNLVSRVLFGALERCARILAVVT